MADQPDDTPEDPKPKRGAIGQSSRARRRRRDPVSGRFVTKLTPEVLASLEQALASGAPPEDAAPFAGISRSTYQEWMREARTPGCAPIFTEFIEVVESAVSRWGIGLWSAATKAARDGDARTAIELLRSRGLMAWPQSRRDIGNADGEPLKILAATFDAGALADLPAEQLEALRALWAAQAERDSNVIDLPVRRQLGP